MKESLNGVEIVGALAKLAKTVDQVSRSHLESRS
jgi:hypothetical protein